MRANTKCCPEKFALRALLGAFALLSLIAGCSGKGSRCEITAPDGSQYLAPRINGSHQLVDPTGSLDILIWDCDSGCRAQVLVTTPTAQGLRSDQFEAPCE